MMKPLLFSSLLTVSLFTGCSSGSSNSTPQQIACTDINTALPLTNEQSSRYIDQDSGQIHDITINRRNNCAYDVFFPTTNSGKVTDVNQYINVTENRIELTKYILRDYRIAAIFLGEEKNSIADIELTFDKPLIIYVNGLQTNDDTYTNQSTTATIKFNVTSGDSLEGRDNLPTRPVTASAMVSNITSITSNDSRLNGRSQISIQFSVNIGNLSFISRFLNGQDNIIVDNQITLIEDLGINRWDVELTALNYERNYQFSNVNIGDSNNNLIMDVLEPAFTASETETQE